MEVSCDHSLNGKSTCACGAVSIGSSPKPPIEVEKILDKIESDYQTTPWPTIRLEALAALNKAYGEQMLELVNQQDPSANRQTGPTYWGNTLRQAIQERWLGDGA